MVLARWQATITDDEGNIQPAASVAVRREVTGAPLAVLYADRSGTIPLGNPFPADADGFAAFHVAGGAYRIDATTADGTRTWRYVAVGTAAEGDIAPSDISYLFDASTADADPGDGAFRFNNATLSSVTTIYIDLLDSMGADLTTWLDRIDDFGTSADRGILVVRTLPAFGEFVARVTGSVTVASGYRKISVTPLSSVGTFDDTTTCSFSFSPTGTPGAGDVSGPSGANDGDVPVFGNSTGKLLASSGSPLVGKQTIWIAGGAFTPLGATAPEAATIRMTNTALDVLRFDPSSAESAFATIKAPKSWNEATLFAQVLWMTETGATGNCVWQIGGDAVHHGGMLNQDASGSLVSTTSAAPGDGANLVMTSDIGPISLTVNSPSVMEGDLLVIQVRRDAANGSDTLAVDASLIGIALYYTTAKNTDD